MITSGRDVRKVMKEWLKEEGVRIEPDFGEYREPVLDASGKPFGDSKYYSGPMVHLWDKYHDNPVEWELNSEGLVFDVWYYGEARETIIVSWEDIGRLLQ